MGVPTEFPEWLRRSKDRWCGLGAMDRLFSVSGGSVPHFVKSYGQTLKPKQVDAGRHYLVKHVVACAWAHGFEIMPPREKIQRDIEFEEMRAAVATMPDLRNEIADCRRQVIDLTRQLIEQRDRLAELTKIVLAFPKTTRDVRGVYFVLDGEQIAYIGSADNVEKRLAHKATSLLDVRVLPVAEPFDHRAIERAFIQVLRPRLNVMNNPDARSENFDA